MAGGSAVSFPWSFLLWVLVCVVIPCFCAIKGQAGIFSHSLVHNLMMLGWLSSEDDHERETKQVEHWCVYLVREFIALLEDGQSTFGMLVKYLQESLTQELAAINTAV